MNNVLDNLQRSKIALTCFYIVLATYAIMLISDFMEYQLLHGSYTDLYSGADANDQRQLLVALISAIAQIVLIVTFIQWFRRAYHNLHKAGIKGLNMTEGWAAGSWFIPIMNLFKPYQIMKDVWVETKNYVARNQGSRSDDEELYSQKGKAPTLAVVGAWWATWIGCSITANISAQIVTRSESFELIQFSTVLALVSDVLGLISILFAIKMIKASQKDQDKFIQAWNESDSTTFNISDSDDVLD